MIWCASLCFFLWNFVRRALQVDCGLSALGLTFTLTTLLALEFASASADNAFSLVLLLLAGFALRKRCEASPLVWPKLHPKVAQGAGLLGLCMFAYLNMCQNQSPDDDFWIHFPLQGQLMTESPPPVHPFFPEIVMNGHFGRDLLIATLSHHLGIGITASSFWLTTLAHLSSYAILIGLVYRGSKSELATVLATLFVFFGMNVGGRGGLLDCWNNNNPLVYLIALSVFSLVHLVYQRSTTVRVVTAGMVLGSLAALYETHFGILGLVLLIGAVVTRRTALAAVGIVALLFACLHGGPIAKLIERRLAPPNEVHLSKGEIAQHQVVELTFPKRELFQIQLASGDYQRRSLVYKLAPNLGAISAISPENVYRPIWSWDVLKIHWLVTFAAPWTLFALLFRFRDPVGLGFWLFGLVAFMTPAVVSFGPVFEYEYYRWQFAAAFGFAGAFGIAAGRFLEKQPQPFLKRALWALFFLNLAPWIIIFPQRALRSAYADGQLLDPFVCRSEADWILSRSSQLAGFNSTDLAAAKFVREYTKSSQKLFSNGPSAGPLDIHFESTFSGISGRGFVGNSVPWPQEPVGTPPFHRSAPARVFWEIPSVELLDQMGVDIIYFRPGAESEQKNHVREWLEVHCEKLWSEGDHALFRHRSTDRPSVVKEASTSVTIPSGPTLRDLPSKGIVNELYRFILPTEKETLWAWAFVKPGETTPEDFREVVTSRGGPSGIQTPPIVGEYELLFFRLEKGVLVPTTARVPFSVEEPPPSPRSDGKSWWQSLDLELGKSTTWNLP